MVRMVGATDQETFTVTVAQHRCYAAVSCRRRASTLLGSGRLAG
jgi:hypothetical protein